MEPEPPFLAGAEKKGATPAPALQLTLQLDPMRKEINKIVKNNEK